MVHDDADGESKVLSTDGVESDGAWWQGPTKFFAAYEQKISIGPCLQNLCMIFACLQ